MTAPDSHQRAAESFSAYVEGELAPMGRVGLVVAEGAPDFGASFSIGLANSSSGPVLPSTGAIGQMGLLAFFTVHFGMFHFVHSVFLNLFFPQLFPPNTV